MSSTASMRLRLGRVSATNCGRCGFLYIFAAFSCCPTASACGAFASTPRRVVAVAHVDDAARRVAAAGSSAARHRMVLSSSARVGS